LKALDSIARALGVPVTDLLPNALPAAIDEELPAIELRQAAGHPHIVWLRVNRGCPLNAAKIIGLLRADDEARKP
jgi:hypothetical protein